MSGPDYAEDIMLHLGEALHPILTTTDSRLVFSGLVALANALGEKLIAAGIKTPEQVVEHYAACIECARDTKPSTEKPIVRYINNGQFVDKTKLS